jgi:hypothetical protein
MAVDGCAIKCDTYTHSLARTLIVSELVSCAFCSNFAGVPRPHTHYLECVIVWPLKCYYCQYIIVHVEHPARYDLLPLTLLSGLPVEQH